MNFEKYLSRAVYKKIYLLGTVLLCLCVKAKADHITGGEIYYTYTGMNNGSVTYHVTFKLFMRCNSGRQFNNPTIVSIFDKGTNQRITDLNINLSRTETISINDADPCISDPPKVCYVVGYYDFNVSLPVNQHGYVLASQVNYRIQGIKNFTNSYSNVGATYTAEIPGTAATENNSAKFIGSDLVIVCSENKFTYSFAATDPDGDELRYSFCEAYRSGAGGNNISPPPRPPYDEVPYGNGFGATSPLGKTVQINPETGLITGVAPESGMYVVTVCVQEVRNRMVIATQRKDLQINIAPCNIAAALLPPDYMLCKDTKTISLINLSNSPLIRTYFWEITDRNDATVFTSTSTTATHTFADTGIYKIKLSINRGESCKDSTISTAFVFPGFFPKFEFSGICFNKPTVFTDLTTTRYGTINSWKWAFGNVDTSAAQHPTYTYKTTGTRKVILTVTNSVGCRDTAVRVVAIVTEPPIKLAFKDTLICKGDPLTLKAEGNGKFTWMSPGNISNTNQTTLNISPATTTSYIVHLDDNGCLNKDTVRVRVTDHVSLQMMNDTTICGGDTIRLRILTDAFTFKWTPESQVINPTVANPLVVTTTKTTYIVKANIGSCETTGSINISTVPYPTLHAGRDTTICYNTAAQLLATTNGSSIKWSPVVGLNQDDIINPVATPLKTTAYIAYAYDTKGCPKPAKDTIIINTLAQIKAFAGSDTAVVLDQPLQLSATGGYSYVWSPNIGLSATNISNPVAVYNETFNQIRYKVVVYNEGNCKDSAYLTVKIFNTGPTVFVPTAFTPNGDGRNDLLKPIATGMKQFNFFRIYNRWGQEVFNTQTEGKGWDGTIKGTSQTTGVYVWWVKATDYKGIPYFKKGTVTLLK